LLRSVPTRQASGLHADRHSVVAKSGTSALATSVCLIQRRRALNARCALADPERCTTQLCSARNCEIRMHSAVTVGIQFTGTGIASWRCNAAR
jgi:hypothetical protein